MAKSAKYICNYATFRLFHRQIHKCISRLQHVIFHRIKVFSLHGNWGCFHQKYSRSNMIKPVLRKERDRGMLTGTSFTEILKLDASSSYLGIELSH